MRRASSARGSSSGPRGALRAILRGGLSTAKGTEVVISHFVCLRPTAGVYALRSALPLRPHHAHCRWPSNLAHLVGRFDPKKLESRREYSRYALYKHKPRLGQLSIILDNEA